MGSSPAKPAKRGQPKLTSGGLRVKHYFGCFSAYRSFVNALQRDDIQRTYGQIDRRSKPAARVRELSGCISHELDRAGRQSGPGGSPGAKAEKQVSELANCRIGTDPRVKVEAGRCQNKTGLG